jgi:hypothetical protein
MPCNNPRSDEAPASSGLSFQALTWQGKAIQAVSGFQK